MTPFEIAISRWDSALMRYSEPVCFANTVLSEYLPASQTKEEVETEINTMFPFLRPADTSMGGFDLKPIDTPTPASDHISDEQIDKVLGKAFFTKPDVPTPDWAKDGPEPPEPESNLNN